jgi:hypothetical protein
MQQSASCGVIVTNTEVIEKSAVRWPANFFGEIPD